MTTTMTMTIQTTRTFLAALTVSTTLACSASLAPAQPQTSSTSPHDLSKFLINYAEDRNSLDRFYPRYWSEQRLERLEAFFKDSTTTLAALDFEALDQAGKIDYLLLKFRHEYELAHLSTDHAKLAEMTPLAPFRANMLKLEESTGRMEPVDARAAADALAAFPEAIKAAKTRVEEGRKADTDTTRAADALKVSPVLARRAAGLLTMLRASMYNWYTFHNGYHPEFSWWVHKPFEEAIAALDDYTNFLRKDVASIKGEPDDPLVGDPIGRDGLLLDLRNEMLLYTPEELIAIGEQEFAWCESEMKKAAAEMKFDDWHKALAKVKLHNVPPGEQDDLVAKQGREIVKFLKDRDLITIPPLAEETWRTEMSSLETQRYLPFAAYNEQAMTIGYPTGAMKHADKLMSMRGNNIHFTRLVTPHELIPGHHLQIYMARRERPERGIFSTPFFVEGWALYWEMVLFNTDWPRGPEDRIGMLFWRMHRCARIIVSLKFHMEQMTPKEMIDFLVERVGHEKLTATSEVRRFIGGEYSPLYQCGYMIGGLQLRALRQQLVEPGTPGTKLLTSKAFHDQLLTYGPIPIEMVRASLLNTPLTRDWQPGWRFQ